MTEKTMEQLVAEGHAHAVIPYKIDNIPDQESAKQASEIANKMLDLLLVDANLDEATPGKVTPLMAAHILAVIIAATVQAIGSKNIAEARASLASLVQLAYEKFRETITVSEGTDTKH